MPGSGWRRWDDSGLDQPFDVRRVEAFEATAEIQMHRGPMPADELRAIDARKVIAQLGPTIELPTP